MRKTTEVPRSWLPLNLAALSFALDELGRHVREVSTNWGPEVEEYLAEAGIFQPAAWCAAFVNWCARKGADLKGVLSPLEEVPLEAYVQSYYQYGKTNGWEVSPEEAGPGDLFLLYFPSKGRYAHMGFVYQMKEEEGWYSTVEGNSNDDGSREGYEVALNVRDINSRTVFMRWT